MESAEVGLGAGGGDVGFGDVEEGVGWAILFAWALLWAALSAPFQIMRTSLPGLRTQLD
jgi:hypothetical protein